MGAKQPLVITGYLGRNRKAPALLEELCDKLPIGVVEMVGSDLCIRSDHEAYLGVTVTTHPAVLEADVILILDCDVPWIPTAGKPQKGKTFPRYLEHQLTEHKRNQDIPPRCRSAQAANAMYVSLGLHLGQN
jgi:thiamine pyrophosphate-dependent acetolactate synthase large subunit-like protein